jgi:hypothetical protein
MFAPISAPDTSAARDPMRDDDSQSPDAFAGLLAGAMNAPAPTPPAPVKQPDGTSELDGAASSDGDDGASAAGGTHGAHGKHGHGKFSSHALAAAGTTAASAAGSASDVVRSAAALDPTLQAKLSRVIDRVQTETGHQVAIAETYRSQGRQNALYAQGRTAAGPVVTWTQNSKHTQGRAVDVVLDNGAAGSDAYADLQRIANEEGLHTLGAQDPGHLELPGSGLSPNTSSDVNGSSIAGRLSIAQLAQVAGGDSRVTSASVAPVAGTAQTATVSPLAPLAPAASVAQVAQAATVARVAQAAQTAQVSQSARVAPSAHPGAGTSTTNATSGTRANAGGVAAAAVAARNAREGSQRFGANADANGGNAGNGGGTQSDARAGLTNAATAFALRDQGAAQINQLSGLAATPVTAASTAAAASSSALRAERVMAAIDDAPARPVSRLTMSVDAGNGTADQVDVALRGATVTASIDAADPRAAQVMSARSDDLVRALSRDGLQVDQLTVRAATTAASTPAQTSADSQGNSSSDRGDPRQQQQTRQRSQDDRRQQQRDQRGARDQ